MSDLLPDLVQAFSKVPFSSRLNPTNLRGLIQTPSFITQPDFSGFSRIPNSDLHRDSSFSAHLGSLDRSTPSSAYPMYFVRLPRSYTPRCSRTKSPRYAAILLPWTTPL
uniref:hypothetical protein n=1 Tax=Mucor indicus TaxID=64623 RepID=UPI002A833540|nr:hypothetical protein UYR97_mgp14 [Mucor indicus]WPA89421.1 hypothetical protein [Mucor indicus]